MAEQVVERLEKVDRELHLILGRLKESPQKRVLTLSQLNRLMEKEASAGVDTTKLIREMRDREYGS